MSCRFQFRLQRQREERLPHRISLLFAVAALISPPAGAADIPQARFDSGRSYFAGANPQNSVVAADFDGDGHVDVAVANGLSAPDGTPFQGGAPTVSILLNEGDGSFQDAVPYPTGEGALPNGLTVGDFNGDGALDLVTANRGPDDASILLGNGDGTFQAPTRFQTGLTGLFYVTAADFNGDGKLDLAFTSNSFDADTVSVLLGNGDGTFQAPTRFAAFNGVYIVAADFNNDGNVDLVTINGVVSMLLGNGDGTFAPGVTVFASGNANSLAVADLNGDGKLDLAIANPPGTFGAGQFLGDAQQLVEENVTVLLGNGDGSFGLPTPYATGRFPWAVAAGDFDGDGKPDLVAVNAGDDDVSVLLNNGDGSFRPAVSYAGAGRFPQSIAVADFNGDGTPDLATGAVFSSTLSILPGQGDGTFKAPAEFVAGLNPYAVASGDFNRDGIPDIAAANVSSNDVSIFLANGDGTLAPAVGVPVGNAPVSIAVGDLNADGNPDMAVVNASDNTVSILPGNGDGTFGAAANVAVGDFPVPVILFDANSDGILDLAVANTSGNDVSILLGKGDGGFQAAANFPAGANPDALAAGDFNGDGKPDLAVADFQVNAVSILSGNGDGSFQAPLSFDTGQGPEAVAVADVNGDGVADLAVANFGADNTAPSDVSILLGNGDGSFQAAVNYPADVSPISIVAEDLNADGKPDLAVANANSDDVSMLLGNGDGTFQPALNYGAGHGPTSLAVADLNGDGKPDLVTTAFFGPANGPGKVSVLLNTTPTLPPPTGNLPPVAQIAATPTSGPAPLTVTFDGSQSSDPDGDAITQYRFDFGDGSAPVIQANPTATHVYLAPGTYEPALTVTDSAGQTSTPAKTTVQATAPSGGGGGGGGPPPPGSGGGSPQSGGSGGGALGWLTLLPLLGIGLARRWRHRERCWVSQAQHSLRTCLLLVLYGSGNAFAQAASVSFEASRVYQVGLNPFNAVVTADFNEDGHTDIAVANGQLVVSPFSVIAESPTVSVLLNKGDGSFQDAVPYPTGDGRHPTMVAAGDFNGDGHIDLVTANQQTSEGSMLLGNGDGSFQAPVKIQVGLEEVGPENVFAVAAADFNHDGALDLAFGANNFFNTGDGRNLTILLGNGDGTFQAPAIVAGSASPATFMTTGDFNRDGNLDIVTLNGVVALYLGLGNGLFLPGVPVYTSLNANSLAVADLNRDGALDLVVANAGSTIGASIAGVCVEPCGAQNVTVLLGTGTGAFGLPVSYAAGVEPWAVATGDFDGDGIPDVAAVNAGSNDVSVLLGNGDGTLRAAVNYPVSGLFPTSIAVADFDGDGIPDLASGNQFSETLSVLPGKGDGTFVTAAAFAAGPSGPFGVAAADFNRDGKPDVVSANPGSSSISVLLGNGDGTLGTALNSAAGFVPREVVTGDFNADGNPDVAVLNAGDNTVSILLGNGDGTFKTAVNDAVGQFPLSLIVGDFDGDGRLDLAVGNTLDKDVSILLGNGDGTFKAAVNFPSGEDFPISVAAGDFNRDGRLDLAVAAETAAQTGTVSILPGNGDGSFQAPSLILKAGTAPGAVAVGDFNEDGKPDLAVANTFGSGAVLRPPDTVSVLLGNGDGTFQSAVNHTVGDRSVDTGSSTRSVIIVDLNGDGHQDIAVANDNSNDLSVLQGNGDGTFQPTVNFGSGDSTRSLAAADLNGDGKLDLVTTASVPGVPNAILVLLNTTPNTPPAPTGLPPIAQLLANPTQGVAPLTVSFDASGSSDSDGDIASYTFDFGDGSATISGASATATHTYSNAGTFTASVTVTDSAGHSDTATATITVTSGGSGGTPPPSGNTAAHLVVTPLSGTAPLDVSFDASGSTGSITTYTFNFGDGSPEQTGASPTASHTYTSVGSFSASVVVTDSQGNTASQAVVITVEQAGSTNPTLPVASLAVSPANGVVPVTVHFDGTGSHDPEGDAIASYTFDFGDNSGLVTQASPTINHTYDAAGTYHASLTVTDDQGQTSAPVFVTITVTTSVTVTPPQGPVAALKLTSNKGPAPLTVGFDGSKSFDPAGGTIQSYTFDFGDGSAVVTRTVSQFGVNAPLTSHVYLVPGTYTPSLSVTNQDGVVSPEPAKATVEATGAGSKGGGALGWMTLLPLLGAGFGQYRRRHKTSSRNRLAPSGTTNAKTAPSPCAPRRSSRCRERFTMPRGWRGN